VVLNYETPDATRQAVASVLASLRPVEQVFVVDNSATRQPDALNNLPGGVRYTPTSHNLGFSGGVNVGICLALEAGASAVLLVNSDATVEPETVAMLETGFAQVEDAGIAGPILRSPETHQVTSRGLSYSRRTGRMRDRVHGRGGASAPVEPVDAVTGGVMLIRRAVFERAGLFDEPYFYAFEDLDFCLVAGRAGFRSIIVTGATAWHEGGRTIGRDSPRRLYFAARNHLRLASRVSSDGWARATVRAFSIVGLNVAHAIRSPGGSLPRRLRAVAAGTRDHLLRRYGAGTGG
jgi:GT2 family glycosyltransferase